MNLQTQTMYPNLVVSTCKAYHGLFTKIRDVRTSSADFVIYAKRLGRILIEDALTEIPADKICIETPCGKYDGVITPDIENNNICAVSILRAGNCLLGSVLECLPGIQVGHLLIQRNEDSLDKKAGHFYTKLPKDIHNNKCILLCDPMLATGGSAIAAIDILTSHGVLPAKILFITILSAPEGLQAIAAKYPEVKVVTAALDERLNENKYIVPGLGDFGDRFYNT